MKRLTSNIEGLSARQLAQRCIGAEELSNGRERKLALGDDILMSVSSPARYVGGEVNSVMKTLTPGMVRFAMCFPGRLRDRHVSPRHPDSLRYVQPL